MENVFKKYNAIDVLNYFNNKLNLFTIVDNEGRVYPRSESSLNVLNILLDNIKASFVLDYPVLNIKKINDKYQINDYQKLFDVVILSSGSKAGIKDDKAGNIYSYLDSLNLKLTELNPSLSGFKTKVFVKPLSGLRVKAFVKLFIDEKLIHEEFGEVIFKDDGISGIVIMNMSSYYNRHKGRNAYISLDLLYGLDIDKIKDVKGVCHPLLYDYYMNNNLDIYDLKNFKLPIKSLYPYSNCQVINGGIDLSEINEDFSLKKHKNIFASGEVLDIDGLCGGYNLLFAFLSAFIISDKLKELKNESKN